MTPFMKLVNIINYFSAAMIKKKRYFLIPILIITFAYLFFMIYNEIESRFIKTLYSQMTAIGKQTGRGISLFFTRYYSELKLLSFLDEIKDLNRTGKNYIRDFFRFSYPEVSGITRMDKTGKIIYTFPVNKSVIGSDISYQNHIKKLLKTKKPILSDVFRTVQGFRAIAYHVPVYRNNIFQGSIAILIPFKSIAEKFFKELKIGELGEIWIVSKKGVLLYSNKSGLEGEEYSDFARTDSKKKIIKAMQSGISGRSEYYKKGQKYLASFLPVKLGNTYWSIAISNSLKEALSEMKSFKNRWIAAMFFFLIIGTIYIFYMLRASSVIRGEKEKDSIMEALKESESNFRLVVDRSPVSIAMFDTFDNLTFVNRRFTELFGYIADDLEDIHILWEILIPDWKTRGKVKKILFDNIRSTEPKDIIEIENIRMITSKRGSRRINIIAGNLRDKKILLFSDITEKVRSVRREKKLHEELARSKKMEALGLLAAGVAHDLNNIFSAFVTYPELIKREFPDSKKLNGYIGKIEKAGEKAAAVVSDLLTITRGVSTKKRLVDMNSLVKDFLQMAEFIELMKEYPMVTLEFHENSEKLVVKGSPFHIEKMVMNLVLNSFEALKGPGKIRIRVKKEWVRKIIHGFENIFPGEYVVLTVEDNGPGFSLKDARKMFDPFFSKKEIGKSGTGLGLTIVWNSAKDHDAKINFSRSRAWTSFRIYFPYIGKKDSMETNGIESGINIKGNGELVMLIDDEEEQRELGRKVLGELGYTSVIYSDGEEALNFLKKKRVDLVLLDMIMVSGMNGREIYDEISKLYPGQKTLIVSGFSRSKDTEKILNNEMTDYIRKPYSIKNIGIAIKNLLEK